MADRPYVFIGSSAEGLDVAKAIQANLDYSCECHIWHQGIFGLGEGTLEALVNSLDRFDFAMLVVTPDDVTRSRGAEQPSPRDNVMFELGLFIGGLGKDRVFMVVDRSAKPKLPSDLAGITPATFEPPKAGTMQSAVGAACTAIEAKVKALGPRRVTGVEAHWWTGCCADGTTPNPDLYMTVTNKSPSDLPWLNVHIFPYNSFQLTPTTAKTERLMAGQYAIYRFDMLTPEGQLSKVADWLSRAKKEEFSVRIFKNNSADGPVLIDYNLGGKVYEHIQMLRQAITSEGPLKELASMRVDLPLR